MKKLFYILLCYRRHFGFLFALLLIIVSAPTPRSLKAGVIFVLAGMFIRLWSASCIKKNEKLTTHGPYAFARNPLYIGSFIAGLGVCLAANSYIVLVLFLILFFTVYAKAVKKEEGDLLILFGEEFVLYKKKVRRFWPCIFPGTNVKGEYSLKQLFDNHEYNFWIGAVLIYGALFLKLIFWKEGIYEALRIFG